MSTQTLDKPKTPTHGDFSIGHIAFDHAPQVALCGKRLQGIVLKGPVEVCVVCADLEESMRKGE